MSGRANNEREVGIRSGLHVSFQPVAHWNGTLHSGRGRIPQEGGE